MDTIARNALRVSLAGAGIVVLGASYIGQASADEPVESPDGIGPVQTVPAPQDVLDTENIQNFLTPDGRDIAKVATDPLALQDG